MEPVVLQSGEGRLFDFGISHLVKIGEMANQRGIAVLELETKHGEEPGEHVHKTEDELFYVISGLITFIADGKRIDVKEGGLVFLPQGCSHAYEIPEGVTARLLVITVPAQSQDGGWGGYIGDVESQGTPIS